MLYNYIIRYPWSNKAKNYLESNNIDLFQIDEKILKKATLFLLKTIQKAYSEKEKQWNSSKDINDEMVAKLFVKIYPLCKILLKLADSVPLIQSFANHFQKQTKFYLNNQKDNEELEDIIDNLCAKIEKSNKDIYYINLTDLLALNLGDDFNIVYSNLESGKIKLNKNDLNKLLSVIVKKKIIRSIESSSITKKDVPKIFIEYTNYIKEKTTSLFSKKFTNQNINKPEIKKFPPCFKKLYSELINGKQLGHYANYHLAVFLANIGYTYNEILNIYRNAPNFDKKIAGYQIKKILEKEYSVANCETLKSNSLCVNNCKVKHPLQLLQKKKKGKSKKKYEKSKNK